MAYEEKQIEAVWDRLGVVRFTGVDMSNEYLLASRILDLESEKIRHEEGWMRAGTVGVDSGLMMLADPCYVIHREKPIDGKSEIAMVEPLDPAFGEHWHDFCVKVANRVHGEGTNDVPGFAQVQGENWTSAVVTSTGHGDGLYPVYIRRDSDGRVAEVKVVFIGTDEGV